MTQKNKVSTILEKIREDLKDTGDVEERQRFDCAIDEDQFIPCSVCGGTGYLYDNVALDNESYGKLVRCDNNNNKNDLIAKFIKDKAGVAHSFDKTFESYDYKPVFPGYHDRHRVSLVNCITECISYSEDFDGWLYIQGLYGTGKTHLAYAICNHLIDTRGVKSLFLVVPEFLSKLRDTFNKNNNDSAYALIEQAKHIGFLVLDDLGAEAYTDWAYDMIFQILDFRYSRRFQTVITSNLSLGAIPKRLGSRISDKNLVKHIKIDAPDYRTRGTFEEDEYYTEKFDLYKNKTWETVVVDGYRLTSNTLDTCWMFSVNPEKWICLAGISGSGKTHIAASIAHKAKMSGVDVVFSDVRAFDRELKSFIGEKNGSRLIEGHISRHKHCQLLIMEDMSSMNSLGNWSRSQLQSLIKYRYEGELSTAFTVTDMNELSIEIRSKITDISMCNVIQMPSISYPEWRRSFNI